MKLADGIRKHGFRKWYERELLQGHAHLALCFICSIGMVGAFEAATRFRSWSDQLLNVGAVVLLAAMGLRSLRRYAYLLTHAESVANQANCSSCDTYGRLELLQGDGGADSVQVRCRKCANVWRIGTWAQHAGPNR